MLGEELLISRNNLLKKTKGKSTTKALPTMKKFIDEKNTNTLSEIEENNSPFHLTNSNFDYFFNKSSSLNVKPKKQSSILEFLQERSIRKFSEEFSQDFTTTTLFE